MTFLLFTSSPESGSSFDLDRRFGSRSDKNVFEVRTETCRNPVWRQNIKPKSCVIFGAKISYEIRARKTLMNLTWHMTPGFFGISKFSKAEFFLSINKIGLNLCPIYDTNQAGVDYSSFGKYFNQDVIKWLKIWKVLWNYFKIFRSQFITVSRSTTLVTIHLKKSSKSNRKIAFPFSNFGEQDGSEIRKEFILTRKRR
jgi:hypothetical protein